jgi:hypothetical protein
MSYAHADQSDSVAIAGLPKSTIVGGGCAEMSYAQVKGTVLLLQGYLEARELEVAVLRCLMYRSK